MAGSTLPERVAQVYYTYGLFCSSYPLVPISLALSLVLLCCYPLLNVPLPGNIPTVVNVPLSLHEVKHIPDTQCISSKCDPVTDDATQLDLLFNETQKLPYIWTKDKPLLYIQQIILRIGVSPWNSNLKIWDAFRAPLQEVFRLLETIRNHQDPETKSTLLQHCYHIGAVKRKDNKGNLERVLPEYTCLILSPANLWQQNLHSFAFDANILNTIYNYQNLQKAKVSVAEMAFGMQLRDTGIKRYPLRSRPRVLQYAVTIFYQNPDKGFIASLTKKLKESYPLHQDNTYTHAHEATLTYYPGQFNYRELVPLAITFVGVFLYVYFSVRKIESVKSKLQLAACAVLTIAGSLSMSMGICFYFGFTLSMQGKEVFPYLVIIVGLENALVLTKSVTSTDPHLDVKIRLAQGLSKEGWSITKNLLTEITIFTVSFFTFVPIIQEFAIFMIVSLLSDYFIQMTFYATVLGVDVRHTDYLRDRNDTLQLKEYFNTNNALNWRFSRNHVEETSMLRPRLNKSKSHPRLNGITQSSPTDVVAKRNTTPVRQHRLPKRIQLVNLWARTRFFQRACMLWMLVWISTIVYNSGIVEYFIGDTERTENEGHNEKKHVPSPEMKQSTYDIFYNNKSLVFSPLLVDSGKGTENTNDTIVLKHSSHSKPWCRLSPNHWSSILSQYNETVAGRYTVRLPGLLLSHRVTPDMAVRLRHPEERDPPPLRWQALAAALDPIETIPDFDINDSKSSQHQWGKSTDLPIYPTTPMEILLLAILCAISVVVIAYMMVVLYRCVCSRHYAEWRASWNSHDKYRKIIEKQPAVQLVMEAVPLVVAGHTQEVECLVTDGERVVSSCLQGTIRVWDSHNGDIITDIDRTTFFRQQKEMWEMLDAHISEDWCNGCSTSKSGEGIPQLRQGLGNYLNELRFRLEPRGSPSHLSPAETTKYDFAKNYRSLYCSNENEKHGPNDSHETHENGDSSKQSTKSSPDKNMTLLKARIATESGVELSRIDNSCFANLRHRRSKVICNGDSPEMEERSPASLGNLDWRRKAVKESPVWCMDFCNDLIILGCADGRLEFWEASSGKLMCAWWSSESGKAAGVTKVRALEGARSVCAATLGALVLLRLRWRFGTHVPGHSRTGSDGSWRVPSDEETLRLRMRFAYGTDLGDAEEVVCLRVAQCRPHQQPITELQAEGGRILTGGQDHILKVFCSSDLSPLFTLHGHCGPITSCFIDHATPTIAGSGSQDGLLCVWDLHTGACLYSMQAHDGAVTSLAYTASYVVSAGSDEKLCIWDRFQGHMLNSIHIGLNYMSRMLPLTHTLLVMGDRSGLVAYDLSSGDVIRRVLLGQSDCCIFVRQILPLRDAIVCDYANQLRIVRFPLVTRMSTTKSE